MKEFVRHQPGHFFEVFFSYFANFSVFFSKHANNVLNLIFGSLFLLVLFHQNTILFLWFDYLRNFVKFEIYNLVMGLARDKIS